MSQIPEIWNLNALCRCCHSDGYFKSLQDSYLFENEVEIYSKMLHDTFNIQIRPPLFDVSYTICDDCIIRLRDALKFKKQVQLCEKKFEEYCKNQLATRIAGSEAIKTEYSGFNNDNDDDGFDGVDDFGQQFEIEIKCDSEFTKKEETEFDASIFDGQIKCEEDNETKIEINLPGDTNERNTTDPKKKKAKKKVKTERRGKQKRVYIYDPKLEVVVKTDAGFLYSCRDCGGCFPDMKHLKNHIFQVHSGGKFKCLHCSERFMTMGQRKEHLKTHAEFAMKCSYCDKVFYYKTILKAHENTHTRTRLYKCDFCMKDFITKSTLRMHLKGHYGTKRKAICDICGHGFNDTTNLNSHIRTVHEKQRPFACTLCEKTFTANKHLKNHMRRHTGEMPYACDKCPKRFYEKCTLDYHKITHTDRTYSYTCKICRRRFLERGPFLKHLRKSHIGQRPHKCTICDKDFICKYSMKRHIMEHSGEKPFACEVCGAKFKQKSAMNRHKDRKHGEPKEGATEKCELCNKLVTDLKRHMLCHNNKKFSCEYCDKSYSENNVLTRHKKVVHFGIKPHVCEYCDKKYVKINSLKNHQLKVHKIVSKIETDEDFDSAVAKFSIKNKKGKIKTESAIPDNYLRAEVNT